MMSEAENRIGHFIDNGDGTVTDTITGLMWMRCAIGQSWDGKTCQGGTKKFDWREARKIRHSFAGHDDWRLPNIDELKTLIAAIGKTAFPDNPRTRFWSSSQYPGYSASVWGVDFSNGFANHYSTSRGLDVRLVRGESLFGAFGENPLQSLLANTRRRSTLPFDHELTQSSSKETLKLTEEGESLSLAGPIDSPIHIGHFIDNGDGTVTDTRTGLTWMRCAMGQTWDGSTCKGKVQKYPWNEAKKLRHTFVGYDDWRLPDIDELKMLIDRGQSDQSIDMKAFPDAPRLYFWSLSPFTKKIGHAWGVDFNDGYVDYYGGNFRLYVRLVRGGQCLESLGTKQLHSELNVEVPFIPTELVCDRYSSPGANLSECIKGMMTSGAPIQVNLDKLLQYLPTAYRNSFGKREAASLAQFLANMGVGMEPDPRFGNLLPKPGKDIFLFNMSVNAPSSPTKEYTAATILMHLASTVAHADGSVSPEEERHLEEHIDTWLHLSADERIRLKAHTQWLLTSFPGLKGIKERLEHLNAAQKESIEKFLVSVAQADGYIDPTEIKILGKIYELLGLDAQNLYSQAHLAAVEPVIVQAADTARQGFAIPRPPAKKAAQGVTLDMGSVEAKLAETVAVSALLNSIFADDEPVTVQPIPVQESTESAAIPGLNAEAFAFMRILTSKLLWSRKELENLAVENGLMLDGTLDSINDASFDVFGEPFCEGDDPIEINSEIAKEIVA